MSPLFNKILVHFFKDLFSYFIILIGLYLAATNILFFEDLLSNGNILFVPLVVLGILKFVSDLGKEYLVKGEIRNAIDYSLISIFLWMIFLMILSSIWDSEKCTDMCGLGTAIMWGFIFIGALILSLFSFFYIKIIYFWNKYKQNKNRQKLE